MIIPFAVSTYNVILFRTFFLGINSELRESAKIDGAGEMRILFQIILPLSKAIIATVGLFTMVGKWNDWFSALIYLTDEKKYPVQMILRKILFNSTALNMNDARHDGDFQIKRH
ncbi:ABC transporter permease subunit [Treponema phagedenis]|uniref:ABC transporter permease subunit n=1 Tax=Treponema phagedenis TaxID=162 RepID=UPI001CA3B734|nr:ABC transporter permease subunit [Treponema phagedenis]